MKKETKIILKQFGSRIVFSLLLWMIIINVFNFDIGSPKFWLIYIPAFIVYCVNAKDFERDEK